MIEEPPILTIKRDFNRPTADQVAAFQGVPSSVVSDALEGNGALDRAIRHLAGTPARSVAGPAVTAGCTPSDMLGLSGAMAFLQPGDIIVTTAGGYQGCAIFGDRYAGMMRNAGVVAAVADAPVRDIDGISKTELPIWCTGLTPASPFSNGPGTVGLPISIGGRTVDSGDMIVADKDGVVAVPFARLDEIAARAAEILGLEAALDQKVANGLIVPAPIEDWLASDRVRYVK